MDESTVIDFPVDSFDDDPEEPSSKTYKLDLDAGRIVGKVDGIQAARQAIRKMLVTPRYKCLIYSNQYGTEIEDAVTKNDASQDYARTAIEGFIKDAFLADSRLLDASDFDITFEDDKAYIAFTASTIYGDIEVEEVI